MQSIILSFSLLMIINAQAQEVEYIHIPARQVSIKDMQKQILYYINQHRAAIGLQHLKLMDAANKEAFNHSKKMATRKTPFGHEGFEERIKRISQREGVMGSAAENVAYGRLTAQEVVKGWLNSPGHKKNIEGNYTYTGIGFAKDPTGVIFFTQIFLNP